MGHCDLGVIALGGEPHTRRCCCTRRRTKTTPRSRPTGDGSPTNPTNPAEPKSTCVRSRTWRRRGTGLDGRRHASALVAHGARAVLLRGAGHDHGGLRASRGPRVWARPSRWSKGRIRRPSTARALRRLGRWAAVPAPQRGAAADGQKRPAPETSCRPQLVEELKRLVPIEVTMSSQFQEPAVWRVRRSSALIGAAAWAKCIAARDTKLDRDVAIKVLPEAFAARSRADRAVSARSERRSRH